MTKEDIEGSTCTEIPQKWGRKGATSQENLFNPVSAAEFCHLPKRMKRSTWKDENVTDSILNEVRAIMYNGTSKISIIPGSYGHMP